MRIILTKATYLSTFRRSPFVVMVFALLSFVFGVPSSVTFAQQGTFVPTGSMATARGVHTATLLNDGKVLIAGGEQDAATVFLASAELYDPTTRTFTSTGSLNSPERYHAATLLRRMSEF